ncbi:2-oxoglutarate and iron-dependent oxygenase domain-containing protein 2-like [Mercenaria mercenaria]|uniref:2-oxoglutarate and iron-dependent oxygenase domain-containing protein 2-like n=1 Tax=Mercenaria mercenaria TaxID=6596 RepID=UPI00234FACFD|nr:2-oxoglutarate and iron-dependent oxygenase domain-containing protein 2-like [Mercenaria mercenaria]
MGEKYFVCACFYAKNIFLKQIKMHVEYRNKSQFLTAYRKILEENGYHDESETEKLILEIEDEVARRKRLGLYSLERQRVIKQSYTPIHPEIYTLKESFLSPKFLDLVQYCKDTDATFEGVFDYMQETEISRGYMIPVFTEEFCRMFLEEVQHFEQSDLPKGRPNTMNKYGVLLDELGFDPFFSTLREQYLVPVTRLLYPDQGGGELDSHKVFVVQYKVGEDIDLDCHYDNAEVTLNIALSPKDSYAGGNLYFGAMRTEYDAVDHWKEIEHKPTFGFLHRGQHMHGASPITAGERFNLILWMRASSVRNKKCPMCDNIPDLQEAIGFGDGFTKPEIVDICSVI